MKGGCGQGIVGQNCRPVSFLSLHLVQTECKTGGGVVFLGHIEGFSLLPLKEFSRDSFFSTPRGKSEMLAKCAPCLLFLFGKVESGG